MSRVKVSITIDPKHLERLRREYAGNVSNGIAIILNKFFGAEDNGKKKAK